MIFIDNKIVTKLMHLKSFYSAEAYHQEYIHNHPDEGYVRNVSIPEFMELIHELKAN